LTLNDIIICVIICPIAYIIIDFYAVYTKYNTDHFELFSLILYNVGDYAMKVYWSKILLRRCPILGSVAEPPPPVQPPPVQPPPIQPPPNPTPPLNLTCDPMSIALSGSGLSNAQVHEEAEFIVDGSNAGPG